MIAYEELEKALSRWKARRASGQAAVAAEVPQEVSGIPSGITGEETPASDSTAPAAMVRTVITRSLLSQAHRPAVAVPRSGRRRAP